jgi:hypothetical protein
MPIFFLPRLRFGDCAYTPVTLILIRGLTNKLNLTHNSNQRFYSTSSASRNIFFVTGFSDASPSQKLVVFDINLKSIVVEKFTRKELAMERFAPYQQSVIVGLLIISNSSMTILILGWSFFF